MNQRLDAYVEDDDEFILIDPDGVVRHDPKVFLSEEQYRRMKQGYLCPWCYQPLSSAFDRTCKDWCWGPRDADQHEWHRYMDERFTGVEDLSPPKHLLDGAESEIWTPGNTR